jgi:C4-dicarboxylate transporter, DctM subunit
MNETTTCILALVLLLALFVTGIELGFAMALVGFLGFAYLNGFSAALTLLGGDLFEAFTN